jgi:hypothetical protein
MFRLAAVVPPDKSATIRFDVVDPVVSVSVMPWFWELIDAVMPRPAPLIAAITSLRLAAPVRSTVAVAPLRSVS